MILASLSQASFHIEATIIHPDSFIARIHRLPYKKTDLSNPFKKNVPFLNRKDAIISLHSQKKKGVQYVNVQYKVSRKSKDSAKVQLLRDFIKVNLTTSSILCNRMR